MWIDDALLENCFKDIEILVWKPKENVVVLGNGNQGEKECHFEACEKDGVPVLRRYGGGGAVVLHPGCLVVSLGIWVKDHFLNDFYFKQINQSLLDSFTSYSSKLSSMYQDGVSDLCYEGKKIVGTSLFRSRNYLLYQASILGDTKIDLIEKYLKHPSKEPSYRKGKSHKDFVIGLDEIIPLFNIQSLENIFKEKLEGFVKENLSLKLIPSVESQRSHLYKKAKIPDRVSA